MSGSGNAKQPHDLEGLLKFCMEVTRSEDAPGENVQPHLDPERRQWLQEALSGLTVDVIKQLAEAIKILSGENVFSRDAGKEDLEKVLEAFEATCDWIGNLDLAISYHKIGGFQVLKRCLTDSPHVVVRTNAANTVAELAQNNPYCQKHFLEDGFLPILVNMMEKESSDSTRVKVLYAVSSIVRDFPEGIEEFIKLGGPSSLLIAIQCCQSSGFRSKASFFIYAVSGDNQQIKKVFSSMGFERQLIAMLQQEEHQQSHEHIAKALLTLLRSNPEAQKECRESSELNFSHLITSRKSLLEGKAEFQEELEYFKEMEAICFPSTHSKIFGVDR